MSVTAFEYLQVLCDALQDVGVECHIDRPEPPSSEFPACIFVDNLSLPFLRECLGYVYVWESLDGYSVRLNKHPNASEDPTLFEET